MTHARRDAATAPTEDALRRELTAFPDELERRSDPISTFYAFRYRNYRLQWTGDLFTSAAQWIQQTVVGWLVYDLTGSGATLGSVNLMRAVPILFVAPLAGVATDRVSRQKIIIWSQMIMALLTFIIAALIMTGQLRIWHMFAFTLLVSCAQTFNMPARQTFVFDLVPRRVAPNAVALSWAAFSLARSVGPAIGGGLIVLFGPANNFVIQGVAYMLVMTSVLMIRNAKQSEPRPPQSVLKGMREGYGFALSDPQARITLLISLISPTLMIPLHMALLPIFAARIFHSDAAGLGILVGSIGFGGLIGGGLTAALTRVDRRGMLQLVALLVMAGCEFAFCVAAAMTQSLWLAMPFLVIAGTAESLYTTTNTTVLQLVAPDHLRGSMAGVLQLSFVVMPIGGLIAGTAADYYGAPAVGMALTATAFACGLAILLFSSRMRHLRLSDLTRQPSRTS
ncbi:MAG: MFS transporter [Chloroflexi bacterium]|nr:MAG: MFS transporter [Chloroflexota bacterium]